jgi:hypothetical protein
MAIQVNPDRAVRVARRKLPGGMPGERRLANARHAIDGIDAHYRGLGTIFVESST